MPPVIKKQLPNGPLAVKKQSATYDPWGSGDALKVLIYGESGTGKTTVAASFPDTLRWLICSGGDRPGELRSIDTPENRKRISPAVVTSFDQFRSEVDHLRGAKYASVVLDHASGFADLVLASIIGKPVPAQKTWGLASQQQYGQLALQCKEAFRELLSLPINVVILAQQRTFGGKDDGIDPDLIKPTVGAALTPSVTGWLNPACDYVIQAFKRPVMIKKTRKIGGEEVETVERGKGVEYCLRVGPHDVFMTKFRVPGGVQAEEIVVGPKESAYNKIVKLIQGGK